MRSLLACLGLVLVAACSSSKTDAPAPDAGTTELQTTFGGARSVDVRVPASYDPKKPAPLLVMLHGYGSGGVFNDVYMHMTSIADDKGFFYVSPDGTIDSQGKHFWNANDGCCDFDHSNVDDVGYLMSLVHDISQVYAIDPKRIFVMGHSNGGYMANRLACDHAETFAAAVSWAGANWSDLSKCQPSAPIGYLQIHGTSDGTVPFGASIAAGPTDVAYAGAAGTVLGWSQKNGCTDPLVPTGQTLTIDADHKAPDTNVARHDGCKDNGAAELWPVDGADHIFSFTPEAVAAVWTFLEAHAKK